mmetsp:Transcript_49265/g.123466  ORF Transcript_49265/g.123466 Transcript_49265/m.123466 type:complete len:294 (-) Transcript_49265:34-915(-)
MYVHSHSCLVWLVVALCGFTDNQCDHLTVLCCVLVHCIFTKRERGEGEAVVSTLLHTWCNQLFFSRCRNDFLLAHSFLSAKSTHTAHMYSSMFVLWHSLAAIGPVGQAAVCVLRCVSVFACAAEKGARCNPSRSLTMYVQLGWPGTGGGAINPCTLSASDPSVISRLLHAMDGWVAGWVTLSACLIYSGVRVHRAGCMGPHWGGRVGWHVRGMGESKRIEYMACAGMGVACGCRSTGWAVREAPKQGVADVPAGRQTHTHTDMHDGTDGWMAGVRGTHVTMGVSLRRCPEERS